MCGTRCAVGQGSILRIIVSRLSHFDVTADNHRQSQRSALQRRRLQVSTSTTPRELHRTAAGGLTFQLRGFTVAGIFTFQGRDVNFDTDTVAGIFTGRTSGNFHFSISRLAGTFMFRLQDFNLDTSTVAGIFIFQFRELNGTVAGILIFQSRDFTVAGIFIPQFRDLNFDTGTVAGIFAS